jgi:hypothetical protein
MWEELYAPTARVADIPSGRKPPPRFPESAVAGDADPVRQA